MTQILKAAFAPTGTLRVAINYGNPILAAHDPATGAVSGVSVDLARALAEDLGLPLTTVPLPAAGQSFTALRDGDVDVAFFAHEPARAAEVTLTQPYVLIEGCYLVRETSSLTTNEEVDRDGTRVAVGLGSAYDLFLTRTLHHATIERAPTSPTVVDFFEETGCDVAAGVRQQLEADAQRIGGLRVLTERFMTIEQAMAVMPTRGDAAARFLDGFIATRKQSGFVAQALAHHDIQGASVAP